MTTATKIPEVYKPYRVWLLERKHGKPIETLLAELLNELGTQTKVAKRLRVTQATVSTWVRQFGVQVEKVAKATPKPPPDLPRDVHARGEQYRETNEPLV